MCMPPSFKSTSRPSAWARDSVNASASTRSSTGRMRSEKGPSDGAVRPTDVSAVARMAAPAKTRIRRLRRVTEPGKGELHATSAGAIPRGCREEKRKKAECWRAICPVVGRGRSLLTVRQPGADLHLNAGEADGLVASLQPERDAIVVGPPEDMLDRKAPFDFALARFVRRAVGRRLGLRAVAPIPFDRGAVILLEVVRTADDLGDERDLRRRHADDRSRLQPELRALRDRRLLRILPRVFLSAGGIDRRGEADACGAKNHGSP